MIAGNLINGQFRESPAAPTIPVHNPATEELVGRAQMATADDVVGAVDAAAQAQIGWRRMPAAQRAVFLEDLADSIAKASRSIGAVLAKESGKSPQDAADEVTYASEILRYHAQWARRIEGEIIPSDNPAENLFLFREPLGVVVCLIPFNYPIYTLLRKVAPALITGNAVVVRPSNLTPLSTFELAKVIHASTLPPGLINILAMDHATAEVLCTHAKVRMITLTGSLAAGRKVLGYSQSNIAKCSLELGGKTPAIVEADADLVQAANGIVASKTTHCGQLCTAVDRVYVQESVRDRFLELLKERLEAKAYGDRAENHDLMGPLATGEARQRVHQMVERAVAAGARVVLGGTIPQGRGFFYAPTLLVRCRQEMEIVQEETFGPVLCVMDYRTIEEAIALANDHQFGLASVLYTESHRVAMQAMNSIEAGELYINRTPADPYQGYHAGWKRSGLGGDDGKHGMLEFTQTRLVVTKF